MTAYPGAQCQIADAHIEHGTQSIWPNSRHLVNLDFRSPLALWQMSDQPVNGSYRAWVAAAIGKLALESVAAIGDPQFDENF